MYLNYFSWQLTAQEFIQQKIRSRLANPGEEESRIGGADWNVRMNTAAAAAADTYSEPVRTIKRAIRRQYCF